MNVLLIERKGKVNDYFISGRQKSHWPTSKLMQAFLVKAAHLKNVITESSSHSFMAMYHKDWGYVTRCEPRTLRQALSFIDVILQIPFGK